MTNHRTAFRLTVLVALVAWGWQGKSQAQLTDYTWNSLGGGSATWQSSNWTQTGAANASPYPNGSFSSANLSVGLGSSLTLNIDGAVDPNHPFVTVGPIDMGGTSGAVTTNIASLNNGYLLFKNDDDADFNDDRFVDGNDFLSWQRGFATYGGQAPSAQIQNTNGDADADGDVDAADLARWEVLYNNPTKFGNARIVSGGVPGSVNVISAPIRLSAETLLMAPESTNDLTLSGEIRPTGGVGFNADTAEERGQVSRIRNNSTKTLFITGAINTIDPADGTRRRLFLNDGNNSRGKIHLTSTSSISGSGIHHDTDSFSSGQTIVIGSLTAILPLTTVQIDSANPNLHGKVVFNTGNLILGNDLALGDPNTSLVLAGSTGRIGFNLLSTDDSRKLGNELNLGQPLTIKGEHSLEVTGRVTQSNSRRGFINLLPAGKTLTLSGRVAANNGDPSPFREFVFDGSGTTLVTGGLNDDDINHDGIDNNGNNDPNDNGPTTQGTYIKRGSGVVKVSGTTSKFRGNVEVEMGNIHFDRYAHLSSMATDPNSRMMSRGGAVGLDTTSLDPSFIALFNTDPNDRGGADTGGLMLAAADATAAIPLNTAALAKIRLMTIAAPETGMTFTGTITPPTTGGAGVANTFRLGGGSGKLTIDASKLTGTARSLYVANGGEVNITGSSNLATNAGTTVEVTARYTRTRQNVAAADTYDGFTNLDSDVPRNEQLYLGTTLTANVLANGGSNSSIGAGAATADRLLIRGATLKYAGAANAVTNRLFTIGTGGATIESSDPALGGGTVDFNGVGALATEDAAPRIASNNSFTTASNVLTGIPSTANLVLGMTVTGVVGGTTVLGTPTIPASTTITEILGDKSVRLSNALPVGSFVEGGTITFSSFNRTLTLTGKNTNNNFLRPTIANASQGTVGVTKRGAGKWILTGDNTYTGPTAVEEGTLLINGNQSGSASAYTVAAGATLGGTGALGGAGSTLVNSGTVAPGTSVGTLTTGGSYTQNAGAKLAIEMTGAAAFDKLVVNGAATLSGLIDVDLQSFTPAVSQTFDIVTATGSLTTSGLTVTGDGNWTASIVGGNTLRLTFNSLIQAVPEPGCLALIAMGMLMLGGRRRR